MPDKKPYKGRTVYCDSWSEVGQFMVNKAWWQGVSCGGSMLQLIVHISLYNEEERG